MSVLARLAARAPVPVFVAPGLGGSDAARRLLGRSELDVVTSPRHAAVLLVVGAVTSDLLGPLAQVHDQLAHPRSTVWWSGRPDEPLWAELPGTAALVTDDPVPVVSERWRALLAGDETEPDLGADRPANAWEGVGPFGQGGEGMMGGTPYGRPMAMTGDDRDGLVLDQLHMRIGPFLPAFPVGLALDVVVQGELVQEVTSIVDLVADRTGVRGGRIDADDEVFTRALTETVPIAELELARARHHLGALAAALVAGGLSSLGFAVAHVAATSRPDRRDVARLTRRIAWSGWTGWTNAGLGMIDEAGAAAMGGPCLRAAGIGEDLRTQQAAYRQLGFAPVVGTRGDVAGRWRQRLAEVDQSLQIAARAEPLGLVSEPGAVEAPEGPRQADGSGDHEQVGDRLAHVLADRDWDDFMATIVSLDLRFDVERAGRPLEAA